MDLNVCELTYWVFLILLSLGMSLGILASSSLSFRFEQATPANIAGVVYKEVFERSERTFYRRKQRYSLPVLPSSPLSFFGQNF